MSGISSSIIIDPGGNVVTREIKRNKTNAITKTIAPIIFSPPQVQKNIIDIESTCY
jgi:hypothetical protein